MSRPFIIWCRQRTGSTNLFKALCSASEHPAAVMEPFDEYAAVGGWTEVGKRMGPIARDRELRKICDKGWLIKHCYEHLTSDFNRALAKFSTLAGYAHIHLYRQDEIARLVSWEIARQYATWQPEESKETFAEWKRNPITIKLDVPLLKRHHQTCVNRWKAVGPLLSAYNLPSELLFKFPVEIIPHLDTFIGIPPSKNAVVERNLGTGQDTKSVWPLVKNIEELRRAIQP